MKKFIYIILSSVALSLVLVGCNPRDFGNINEDPNNPTEPNTEALFTFACEYLQYFFMGDDSYDPWQQLWTGYMSESKNNQYGVLGTTTTFNSNPYYLYPIKNLQYIINLNSDEATKNATYVTNFGSTTNQIAAASTLQAFFYLKMTDILGPIVYSEAMKGESEDIWSPKYDNQKDVYTGLFSQLETAYAGFDENSSLSSNDFVYNGDVSKWKKFNASVRMLMAIKLADVDPSTGKTKFAAAYKDGGIEDNADAFAYTFHDNNLNTLYLACSPDYSSAGFNFVPNSFIVDTLKAYNDNRMFAYFDLEGYKGTREGDPNNINDYYGVPLGLIGNDAVNKASANCCSFDESLLTKIRSFSLIPAARMLLTEAEAAQKGWIDADPKELYERGIKASFEEWGASGVEDYLSSDKVAYDSDNAFFQICIQRWIASFLTDGIEVWSDWRRTDIPFMPVGQGAVDGGVSHYPYRLGFGTTDRTYNTTNYEAACADLSSGEDDRSARVWWDVADNREGVIGQKESGEE